MYYRIHETDEAIADICRISCNAYDYTRDKNSGLSFLKLYDIVAEGMAIFPHGFSATKLQYRGYVIHILPFANYYFFFVISDSSHDIYVLRILYQKQDWNHNMQADIAYHIYGKEIE